MSENKVTHLGVIMDGNRRWARKHMLESVMRGHEKGLDTFMNICTWCQDENIPYLSVYAFSTENWERSIEEVSSLFKLMEKFFTDEIDTCLARGIRIKCVGDLTRLDPEARETVRKAEALTAECRDLTVLIALSYGGRAEITDAANEIARRAAAGELKLPLDEAAVQSFMYAPDVPDPDLIIRTSGELRTSNFLLWESAYSEYYFTDVLWPDFGKAEFDAALESFSKRSRRMGGR